VNRRSFLRSMVAALTVGPPAVAALARAIDFSPGELDAICAGITERIERRATPVGSWVVVYTFETPIDSACYAEIFDEQPTDATLAKLRLTAAAAFQRYQFIDPPAFLSRPRT